MRWSHRRTQVPGHPRTHGYVGRFFAPFLIAMLSSLLLSSLLSAQDVGSQEKEFMGNGAVITITVHEPDGAPLFSPATVKLFRGIVPSGQRETSRGVAEFVVVGLGEFTVVVTAPGYRETQKDVSVDITGSARVDVYLGQTSAGPTPANVRLRPLLAPKAKEALDKGLRALRENKLAEADKHMAEAMRLAPGNPEVLYAQGVLNLKQRDWGHAQTILEKATQIDPNFAPAFSALGLALCDQGNYDAAIVPLLKSLELDPAGEWETRWALAKSYYQQEQYPEALRQSQEAFARSNGSAPAVALLLAQSLTAVERYEDAAQVLREFLKDHASTPEATKARRWLEQLAASGKIRSN